MHGLSSANFVDTCLVFCDVPTLPHHVRTRLCHICTYLCTSSSKQQAGKQAACVGFDWIVVRCFASMACFEVPGWESHATRHACVLGQTSGSRTIMSARWLLPGLRRLDLILSVALGCRSTHSSCPSHSNEKGLMGRRCCSCC